MKFAASERRLLAGVLVLGCAVRLLLAATTPGDAYDMESYRIIGEALSDGTPLDTYEQIRSGDRSRNPYPPGYWPVIYAVYWVEQHIGLALETGIRLIPILADCALALLVWIFLKERGVDRRRRLIGAGLVALGPLVAWVSSVHGHFDSVATLPAVVAVMLWDRPGLRHRALIAGVLIGTGAAMKTVPILMLAALLPSVRSLREAAVLCGAAIAVPALLLAPFALTTTDAVRLIFTYEGVGGVGGISLLAQPDLARGLVEGRPITGFNAATRFLFDFASPILFAAIGVAALLMRRARTPAPQAAVVVWLITYVLGYGFAPRYLVWAIPLLIMTGRLWQTAAIQVALLLPTFMLEWGTPYSGVEWSLLYIGLMLGVWFALAFAAARLLFEVASCRPPPAPT